MSRYLRLGMLSMLMLLGLRACCAVPVTVTVSSDRITYRPGATGMVTVTLDNHSENPVTGTLVVRLLEGIDQATPLFTGEVMAPAHDSASRTAPMSVGTAPWGRGLEARFTAGKESVLGTHAFSVVTNPYQVGMFGQGVPQSGSEEWDEATARKESERIAAANLANYCNVYEAFAWAPCDFSKMTVDNDEPFFAGQTFYCMKRSSLVTLHQTLHRYGISAITYGKTCAGGEPGVIYAFRHPEQMNIFGPAGFSHEAISVDVMDRMAEGRYPHFGRDDTAWQYWISCWTQIGNLDAVNYGTDEIVRSAKEFGWDGVRYDGHFTVWNDPLGTARMVKYAGDRIQQQAPGFGLGYNCISDAQTDPEVAMTDPELAAISHNGGLAMSEVYRNYRGNVMLNIRHLQSVGDAVRMNGGYFLCISDLTTPWNTALMFAGGARPMGGTKSFNKFATRFSGMILDPAMRRLQLPDRVLTPAGDPGFLWDPFIYERKLSATRSQLILHLVNVSRTFQFQMPWGQKEKPPIGANPPREYVPFQLHLPAGYTAERAFACDDAGDFALQPVTFTGTTLIVPRVKMWTMVVIELNTQTPPRTLAELCAVPLKKGKPITPDALQEIFAKGMPPNAAPTMPQLTTSADFAQHQDGVDRKAFTGADTPMTLWRDGRPDIHYARGIMYRWNRPWEALMRVKNCRVTTSSLDDGRTACGATLSAKNTACVADFPTHFDLSTQDVLVIDNIPAAGFTLAQRHDVLDFVKGGGSLLVLGDWHGLSKGCWEGSFLEEVLPVRTRQANYLLRLQGADQSITATPAYQQTLQKTPPNFGPGPVIEWTSHLQVKDGAEVLLKAGKAPFLVVGKYGAGRVAVLAGAHAGTPAHPYWESDAWPAVMADVLNYLAAPATATVKPGTELTTLHEKLDGIKTKKIATAEVGQSLRLLLAADREDEALYAAKFILEHPDAVSLDDARQLTLQIVPHVKASAPWRALGQQNTPMAMIDEKENPEPLPDSALGNEGVRGANLLAALIAALAVPDVNAQTFLGWEGLDTPTRLWCIGLCKDPEAVDNLQKLSDEIAAKEKTWGSQLGQPTTRVLRPFVSFALLQCGKRDEQTRYQFCRGALQLSLYAWRERWVLQSLYADAFYDHTDAHRLKIAAAERASREMDYAEQLMPLLFRPEVIGADDVGKRTALKALQEVDCVKAVPLAFGYLNSMPAPELAAFRGLSTAKLDVLRQYIKGK